MAKRTSKVNPNDDLAQDALEHLVVAQLRDLLVLEQALQKRYTDLRSSKQDSVGPEFEAEVLQLSSRADRLHRMMNAMPI